MSKEHNIEPNYTHFKQNKSHETLQTDGKTRYLPMTQTYTASCWLGEITAIVGSQPTATRSGTMWQGFFLFLTPSPLGEGALGFTLVRPYVRQRCLCLCMTDQLDIRS